MINIKDVIVASLLSIIPISEIRGGIPYALYYKLPWILILLLIFLNIIIVPVIFLFLDTINNLFLRVKPYERFFKSTVERTRKKLHKKIEKYGYLGLTIFVGIPLPFTGAYTGALGAWIFGMNRKKAFLAIALGVIIASIITTIVVVFGIKALSIFTKRFF
ncbi:MAG: small multi-drug export protein [Candidatus Woesearchaeota archaeon]